MEKDLAAVCLRDSICRICALASALGLGFTLLMLVAAAHPPEVSAHSPAPAPVAETAAVQAPPTLEAPVGPGAKWLPVAPKPGSAAKPMMAAEGELTPDLPLPEHSEDVMMQMHPRTLDGLSQYPADFGVYHLSRH